MKYERLITAAISQPWAITERMRIEIESILAIRSQGGHLADEKILAAIESKRQKPGTTRGDAALIPIYGVITQRADIFTEWSGGSSTESVGRELDAALADGKISTIVLDIDSPGGGVYGVEELAAKIYAARKEKKVIAVSNSLAASAAYWLGCQAGEFVVSPNGEVGSIGVYQLHVDSSAALAESGQKVTIISAGERKTAGHPYGPLDEIGQAELQAGVSDYYEIFVKAVARGRNVSQATVREGFGRGGVLRAEAAVKEGMADRIATLDDVLAKYGTTVESAARYSADHLRRRMQLARSARRRP